MTERIRINKALLTVAQSGKTVVHLYSPGPQYARFPTLTLFDLGLLINIGIDPNCAAFLRGDAVHCNLWAHYERGEKLNSKGTPYKNVVSLERVDAPATTTSVDTSAILAELRAIKALLLDMATGSQPLATEQTKRVHAIMQAGRADPPAAAITTEPQTTEPEPELSEAEARTEFYTLAGAAIAEGRGDPGEVNDLAKSANGDGWNGALARLKKLLAT